MQASEGKGVGIKSIGGGRRDGDGGVFADDREVDADNDIENDIKNKTKTLRWGERCWSKEEDVR